MKAIVFLLVLCALLAAPARARLGETRAECEARYGMPLKEVDVKGVRALVFSKSGFSILVLFDGDRVGSILYTHDDGPKGAPSPPEITGVELETLLNANAPQWSDESEGSAMFRNWSTPGRQHMANYNSVLRQLLITTKSFADKLEAATNAAAKKKIEGL